MFLFCYFFFADCFKMPSVPQGAFAVHKLKEKHQHVAVCKVDNCNDEKPGRFDLKHSEFRSCCILMYDLIKFDSFSRFFEIFSC